MPICPACRQEKDITKFSRNPNGSIRHNACFACRGRKERAKLKLDFLEAFNYTCSCCGETDPRFLTLDHVNNDGNIHREKYNEQQILRLARKESYSRDKYQCLCFNCNSGKSINGGICPHKCVSKEEYIVNLKLDVYTLGRKFVKHNVSNIDARVAGRQIQALLLRLPKENADAIRKLLGK